MPRFVRRSAPRRKRPTKWCGVVNRFLVPDSDSIVANDSFALCPTTTAVHDQADPVVGWVRGHISLARILGSMPSPAVAWAIVKMQTLDASTTPVQIFNPFSADDIERQDILGMGHCVVPPIVLKADDTQDTQRGTSVTEINIKVGRKLLRNTQNLLMWIASTDESAPGTDDAFRAVVTVRTLMKF